MSKLLKYKESTPMFLNDSLLSRWPGILFISINLQRSFIYLFIFLILVGGINKAGFGQTATSTWPLTSDGSPVTSGNIAANAISGGLGIGGISFGGSGANASGWNTGNRDTDDYYEFTISPAAGYDLNVTGLSFEQFCTSNKDESGAVFYSTDGFSTSNQLGTNFTVPRVQTNTTFNSLNITINNGDVLTIRIYAWGLLKASDLFYNENVIITGITTLSATPLLILTQSNIDFGYVAVNTTSSEMMYQVSGENLDGSAITVTALADFEISISSGSGFTSSISLSYSGNTLPPTTIYCRFSPTSTATNYSDNISHSGGGASAQNVTLTGTTIVDCVSGAVAILSSSGITNPGDALGEADLTGAILIANSGVLALDLTGGGLLASGAPVDIYWNSGHTSQSGLVLVEVSDDGSVWTIINSYIVNSGGWSTQNIALNANTRYIRFTSQNNRDVLIDAVEFDPPPTILCPSDVNAIVDPGSCTATGIVLGSPSTSDNCGVAGVTNNAPATYSLGTTLVLWTVTDIAGNTATCNQNVSIIPEEEIDVEVVDLANLCQSGQTGTTTLTWSVQLIAGTPNWSYDYTINDGSTDVASGTNINATGDITISYTMNNQTSDKTYSITINNLKDNCGISETGTTNNTDDVVVYAVPTTGEIIPD